MRRGGGKSGVTSIRGFSSLLPGSQKDDHKVAGRRALSRRDICHMLRNGNVCDSFLHKNNQNIEKYSVK